MALEHLSGPHVVLDNATDVAVENLSQFRILWVDPVGFLVVSPFLQYFVQMDASAFPFAQAINNRSYGLAMLHSSPVAPSVGQPWYSTMQFNGSGTTPASEWALDRTAHIAGALLSSTAPGDVSGNYAHVHDRFIKPVGGVVQQTDNAADTWTTEATLTGFANGAFLSWARQRGRVWIGSTDGRLVLYDYVDKAAASPVYQIGIPAMGLFYSAKHDVFVSMHSNGLQFETNVWARTALPTSISAPTASPAVSAGHASALSTRVLGAHSDACVNEAVAWTLTGEGELDAATTLTDEDGYATNRLVLPVDAAGPNVQVGVEVLIP